MPVKGVLFSRLGLSAEKMPGKRSVCRCLFGQPNHEDLRKDLDAQLKSANAEFKSTWNYDPELDSPLAGRLDWSLVSEETYVPEFYRKGYRVKKTKARRSLLEEQPELDIKSLSSPVTPSRVPVENIGFTPIQDSAEDMRRENETTPEARILRQSTIKEFMKNRKRRLSDDLSSSDEDDRPTKSQRLEDQ